MPESNSAILRAGGLILAGAIAGLSGGAYSGSESGRGAASAQVQRELGSHDARIDRLAEDVNEVQADLKSIQRDVHEIGSQLDRIESLVEQEDR